MILRPYQETLKGEVYQAWNQGARNVLMRLGTGGGKTAILSSMTHEHGGATCLIAHRQELVGQLSLAIARYGIAHDVVAAQQTKRAIAASHMTTLGRSWYRPGARVVVASVDTLVRAEGLEAWLPQVTRWVVDEAHHLVTDNKWHTAISKFTNPHCLGLGPTATPERADRKGLGRHASGVMDLMVQGPPERWLIDQGYLTDYRIIAADSDLEQFLGAAGASGDWSPAQLKAAAGKSKIVGDTVASYLRFAKGKLGVTFVTDIDTAERVTAAYRAAGVRAETLTGKTDSGWRSQILINLAARKLDQIVAVDVISEGYDLPAIEVETMDRPSESLALYMQQFGRALRPVYAPGYDLETQSGRLAAIAASAKPKAIIIDKVGNWRRHGLPDAVRDWSLNDGERRSKSSGAIPLRACLECYEPYESFRVACPHCGARPEPAGRSTPALVEGDLIELDPEVLARMRGEVEAADMSPWEYQQSLVARHTPPQAVGSLVKHHAARQEARDALRAAMAAWGGYQRARGLDDREIQRLFWTLWQVDVLSAQALSRADAAALTERLTAASK